MIARLTQEFEERRRVIVSQLLTKLNGKLNEADRTYIEGAFRLLQNQFLHGPISALAEESTGRHTFLEALRKLFRLDVIAVEVDLVIPSDDPSEPCYEPETVKFLQEVKERAERDELSWLKQHGKVYAAIGAA